jgi:hypothetical protein
VSDCLVSRLLGAAVLIVVSLLAPAATADASFPGQNGKIAFASNRDGNWEIYSVNPDGSGLTNLTHHSATDLSPAWAPDGRSLVFRSDREGWFDYVMKPDGSSPIFLCRDTPGFALSPDGKEMVRSGDRLVIATFTTTWGAAISACCRLPPQPVTRLGRPTGRRSPTCSNRFQATGGPST